MQQRDVVLTVLVAMLGVVCVGCGSGLTTVPATGEVRFPDGSPFTDGGVEFSLAGSSPPVIATGEVSADGSFRLMTGSQEGAPAGDYEVAVVPTLPDDFDSIPKAKRRLAREPIDRKFWDYATSGLRFTVTDDPSQNHFKIEVARPK